MLRIIAGDLGGRRIESPSGRAVRPTSEMAREALFSTLTNRTPGAFFLDLFAGTGIVGVEALSRGANFALFVDDNRDRCARLTATLKKLSLGERSHVARANALDDLAILSAYEESMAKFERLMTADAVVKTETRERALEKHIVFADPPYETPGVAKLPQTLGKLPFLGVESIVIFEHSVRLAVPKEADELVLVKEKRYGEAALSYYRRIG